jgi:uncharacterized protein (DUF1778 family)
MTGALNRKNRDSNLNIRVTPEQKQVIAQAAQLKQTTVSNFVLEQAFEAAQDIVLEQRHFTLTAEQWKSFCAALEAAPRQYPRLRKLLTEPGIFDKE